MSLLHIASRAITSCEGGRLCHEAAKDIEYGGGSVHLLGAGKAAVQMAWGVSRALGSAVQQGVVVTKDEHDDGFAPDGLHVMFAGHPEPDARSARAGRALAAYLRLVDANDQVIVVLSGGASALLAMPVTGLTAELLAAATRAMLAAGVSIEEINIVRRHITTASGGRLAHCCAAPIEVMLLSDVLSNDLSSVGSGPFAPDDSCYDDALGVAQRVDGIPTAVIEVLKEGAYGARADTLGSEADCFRRVRHRVLASNRTLLDAAESAARDSGFSPIIRLPPSGDDVTVVADRLLRAASDLPPGGLLISGGEPTVTLPPNHGLGGRNQQLALCLAKQLHEPLRCLCIGSDGGDGSTDAAGALVDENSWVELSRFGSPTDALAGAASHELLDAAEMLIRTGPTGTNVLDLHLIARPRLRTSD